MSNHTGLFEDLLEEQRQKGYGREPKQECAEIRK